MKLDEIEEAEAIHREDALRRIDTLIRRYNFTPTEIVKLFSDKSGDVAGGRSQPQFRPFIAPHAKNS